MQAWFNTTKIPARIPIPAMSSSMTSPSPNSTRTRMVRENFGQLPDGTSVEKVTLCGGRGFEVGIITFGAAVQALHVPDREGRCADIVLGHDELAPYLAKRQFFGATVGRYANRIAGGCFELDGLRIQLPRNDGPNSLHGGPDGFDRRLWQVRALDEALPSVTLAYDSPEGEGGFPGALSACVTYAITDDSAFSITFEAQTNRPTIVNLTHHGFFNLAGIAAGRDVLDHRLTIDADSFLPADATGVPSDGPEPVAGTVFDFTHCQTIGARIRDADEQLRLRRGYDHNFCLRGGRVEAPRTVARIEHPASGRVMTLMTDQPGLQFYSGNFLDGSVAGKGGRLCRQSDAFCLEPQMWPDAPNRPDFPSVRLNPGEVYRHVSIFQFSTV
jgi:aldose 1-epimerase